MYCTCGLLYKMAEYHKVNYHLIKITFVNNSCGDHMIHIHVHVHVLDTIILDHMTHVDMIILDHMIHVDIIILNHLIHVHVDLFLYFFLKGYFYQRAVNCISPPTSTSTTNQIKAYCQLVLSRFIMYIGCSIVLYNNYHNVLEFTHRGNIDGVFYLAV